MTPRHRWNKTASDTTAHYFQCAVCGLYRKNYMHFNTRVVSYSRDGIFYTITGTAHPLPVCIKK